MEMYEAIDMIRPHVFTISTPNGSGTGWLVSLSKNTALCAVATAAHGVDYSHYWELPIRQVYIDSGKNILLRAQDRAVQLKGGLDTTAIVFNRNELVLPEETLNLIEPGYYMKQGVEIGWLGFPAIYKAGLCFFSGRVSNYVEEDNRYFVDGVAINGVSGGPAFRCITDSPELVGVVSAYVANRATGETLPGVAVVVQDVIQFHGIAERFKNLDDAKATESPPGEPPSQKESSADVETRA